MRVIVPCHRPDRIADVVRMWRAQSVPSELLLVLNGPALHEDVPGDVLAIRSLVESAPFCRTLGLRASIGDLVVLWDDDDVYEPDFLASTLSHWSPGSVVGKRSHWLRTSDDRLLLCTQSGEGFLLNQTLMFECSYATPPWFDRDVHTDDTRWFDALLRTGLRAVDSGINDFCFHNHSGPHLWAPPDAEWTLRSVAFDCGLYDPAVVRGEKEPCRRERIRPSSGDAWTMWARLNQQEDRI